ncbi:hypothetical protein yc1106_04029 [Curvularia clavata]|uniref:Pentatricopeptide repeat-containing protein n=1 Tax=Curvularia clavata TaxID=95742 RepID=A0A9Q8Z6U9_CURCL|nr:hypothetical protein yc1106_04029 [Curvularia clavata]
MPRVRVPNASFVASADLPILPFLAPRAFVQSPIPGTNRLRNARVDAAQEENHIFVGSLRQQRKIVGADDAREAQSESRSTCCQQFSQRKKPDAGLLQTHSRGQRELLSVNTVNWLYADISTFARKHARSYATAASSLPSEPTRDSPSKDRRRRAPSNRSHPILAQNAPLLAAKRYRALALERARLLNYISKLPPHLSVDEWMKRGRYRSLARRVSNLQCWNATRLDFTKAAGRSRKPVSLNSAFAALDRALYTSLRKHTRKIVIKHDPQCVRLSRKLFPSNTPLDSHMVWKNWVEFDVNTRKSYAYPLLIYLLDRLPGLALRFIEVISNDQLLRGQKTQAIADSLGHLSKIHTKRVYGARQKWGVDPVAHRRLFVPAFVNIFTKSLARQPEVCSQDLLYNLVELAEIDDLKKVFDYLTEHRTRIGFDTMLHYASAFGEAGEVEYALKCLDELRIRFHAVAWKSVVERERLRWTCATILRKSMSTSHDFHQTPSVVAAFVRLGIKMDILLYNIVMHNAMEAGDYTTAFKVYNALESNGLEPDQHTYAILLHGCTLQSNPAMFQSFAHHCVEVAQQTKNPWLATDYLYYLYVRHQTDVEVGHRSALLWGAYSKLFSTEPLEPFITSRTMTSSPAKDEQEAVLSPPPVALYVMMQAEIQSAAAISNQRVLNLYEKFKSVANETSNPAFKSLIQNPTIWNAFLLAFSQKQQFANASQVIKDMTEGVTKPNVYSWNILMQAFFKTGQVQAAERVFEIMRSRGIDADQFTHGILIRGYAKAQLIERIGETMQDLETDQELEPDLLRALAAVVNRRQLMLTLEKARIYKEVRARDKADKEAKEERMRWQPPQFEPAGADAGSGATATAYAEVPNTIPNVPGIAPKQETEDVDIYGFLRDEAIEPGAALSVSSTPTSPQVTSEPPLQQPQTPKRHSRAPAADIRDPEVQYRKLQEQLGLIGQSEAPAAVTQPSAQRRDIEPVGASIGFKSLLDARKGKVASTTRVVPKGRIRSKIKRGRLDRPFSDA